MQTYTRACYTYLPALCLLSPAMPSVLHTSVSNLLLSPLCLSPSGRRISGGSDVAALDGR